MKIIIATFALVFAFAMTGMSQTPEYLTVKSGKQGIAKKSKLRIKFISLVEDSRCPEGVNCVWAGNAKIKVKLSNGQTSKEFEFNSNDGPKGDSFDGWAVYLEELTPYPKQGKAATGHYKAKFKVIRLTR
ncbi:MAG: hypothetical protein KA956_13550 [Pyrinomonadaceae bacterium]|nr:hypothetical protein [Acidobacteriota bacterium]MBP7377494.1 hypothetical protein [Pyrinomonadaceae bacterium]